VNRVRVHLFCMPIELHFLVAIESYLFCTFIGFRD
jgi:hypothetical protein